MFQYPRPAFSLLNSVIYIFLVGSLIILFFAFGLASVLMGSIFPDDRIMRFLNEPVRFFGTINFRGVVNFNQELKTTNATFQGNLTLSDVNITELTVDQVILENADTQNLTLNDDFNQDIIINNEIQTTDITVQNVTTHQLNVGNNIESSSQTIFSSMVTISESSDTFIEFFDNIGSSRPLLFTAMGENIENGGDFFIDQSLGSWDPDVTLGACLTGTPNVTNQFLFAQLPLVYGGFTVTGINQVNAPLQPCDLNFALPDTSDGFVVGNGPATLDSSSDGILGIVFQRSNLPQDRAAFEYLAISGGGDITISIFFSYYMT